MGEAETPWSSRLGGWRVAGAGSGSQDEQKVQVRMKGGRGKKGRADGCWGLARWEGRDTMGHGGVAECGGVEK